jgi:uncharacterized protein YbjT (DUF2867 family)
MITIIGASGQIGNKVAAILLDKGQKVRVIGRRADALKPLAAKGAEVVVGDASDVDFLIGALKQSSAVFTMIPPNYGALEMLAEQAKFGETIAVAVSKAGVEKIVNLSSIGAELSAGTGPIRTLHAQEQRLNKLTGIDLLHLRPAYFMENLLNAIPVIKQSGKLLDQVLADAPVDMVATKDIAAAVADALANPRFTGKSVRYLLGTRTLTFKEVAPILGASIGKPDLVYEQIPAAPIKKGMMAHGFSQQVVDLFEEMANALSNGKIRGPIRNAANTTPTSIEEFAKTVFAPAYR